MRRPALAIALALAVSAGLVHATRAAELDWEAEQKESLELLRTLVRFDTQDGNETKLLEHVKAVLEKDGFAPELHESAPGRGNLIVRMKGQGKGKALLLMAHVDTVKADKSEGWSADPLAAEIKNGVLVGRGCLDDKGQAALAVTTLKLLKKEGITPARDIVVMLNADEESTGKLGAGWMLEKKWDTLSDVGAALNEGGRAMIKDGKVVFCGIQTAEKVYNDVVLRVKGESGHSSVPRPDNAIVRLSRILTKLDSRKTPLRVIPAALGTFKGLQVLEKDEVIRQAMLDLQGTDEGQKGRAAEVLADANPMYGALLRTTIAPTIVKGGVRVNQLPPNAEVNLNVRLLPDEPLEKFLVNLKYVMRDEEFEVEVVSRGERSPPSSSDHPLFKAVETAARRAFPDAPVMPTLSTGATDSRFLRNKGIASFGIGPFALEEAMAKSVHGPDERMPVESFHKGLRFYYDAVKSYATTGD